MLLVVDVQERLFAAMDPERREDLVKNIKTLVATARRLGLALRVSEQYPTGLGRTLPEIGEVLGPVQPIEKVTFSCCGAEGFLEQVLHFGRSQIQQIKKVPHSQ